MVYQLKIKPREAQATYVLEKKGMGEIESFLKTKIALLLIFGVLLCR